MKFAKLKHYIFPAFLIFFIIFLSLQSSKKKENNKKIDQFLQEVKKIAGVELSNSGVDYSVYVKKLEPSGGSYKIGLHKQFPAASLLKVPILAVAIKAINEGKVLLNEKITIEKKDITGGSGKLKAVTLPYVITFEKLLELMISVSDNTATNKVITLLGEEYIISSFDEMQLNDTVLARKIMDFSLRNKGVENYTSSSDVAWVLEKLYRNELYDPKLCDLGVKFLKKQKVRDRIPRFLPEGTVVAHKTGLERGVVHDAGIVFSPDADYIICVLVKNERVYARSKKFIAQVSLLTYNLMNSDNQSNKK